MKKITLENTLFAKVFFDEFIDRACFLWYAVFIQERVEQGEMKMFGMDNGQVFQAASGAELYTDGVRYEEDDSSLSFEDFYFVNGGSAGYILTSPSGRKFSVKVGDKPFVDTRSYFEAREILLSQL